MSVLGDVGRRLRQHGPSLLLAATAAGAAFGIASLVVGPSNAVFAPVAAVVSTGLSAGQRVRRAVEITLGVVLGLVAADLLTRVIGVGPWQLALAVLIAMAAAVAVRPSGLMANQAAVAAPDPNRAARLTAKRVVDRLIAVVVLVARSVRGQDLALAEAALSQMDSLDGARGELEEALATTRERLVLTRSARDRRVATLPAVKGMAGRLVVLVAAGRGLCRAAANFVRHAEHPDDEVRQLADALDALTVALRTVGDWLQGTAEAAAVRSSALTAATMASEGMRPTQAAAVLVGQIRSTVVDVLRITGLGQADAVAALEAAAGRADRPWT